MKEKIKRQFCDLWQNFSFFNFFSALTFSLILLLFLAVFGFSCFTVPTSVIDVIDTQVTLSFLFLLIFYAFFRARLYAIEHLRTIEAQCDCVIDVLHNRLDDFVLENLGEVKK